MEDLARTVDEEEVQLVVFQLGREEYAVEVSQVREIISMVDVTRLPNAPAFMKGVVNLRGQILAVIDLAERLDIQPGEGDRRIIVSEVGDSRVGMIVDSVSEVLRVPAGSIEANPVMGREAEAGMIKGVIKSQNRLLILLDAAYVLRAVEGWAEATEAEEPTAGGDSEAR